MNETNRKLKSTYTFYLEKSNKRRNIIERKKEKRKIKN